MHEELIERVRPLEVRYLGLIPYDEGLRIQGDYLKKVLSGSKDFLLIVSHPPTVTTGRATQETDVYDWSGPLFEVSRGGKATYHGPHQFIVYPIIHLGFSRGNRKRRDVISVIRTLEESVVKVCYQELGIDATGKIDGSVKGLERDTGVWVGTQKIASIGIAVKNWVTYHGMALNIESCHETVGIHHCGYRQNVMSSVESVSGREFCRKEFESRLIEELCQSL